MKALVSAISMVLGSALVLVIVTLQNDPLAFSRVHRQASDAAASAEAGIRLANAVVASTQPRAAPESIIVWVEETRVIGRVPRPARMLPPDPAEPAITVLPAPCNDGEYRLLDETRGVRLSCNVAP